MSRVQDQRHGLPPGDRLATVVVGWRWEPHPYTQTCIFVCIYVVAHRIVSGTAPSIIPLVT